MTSEPCPRCLRKILRDAFEPVKYPEMTLYLCPECARDERKEVRARAQ